MNINGDMIYRTEICHHRVAVILMEATVTHLERKFPAFSEMPKIIFASLTTPAGA
jgi:hypothetical protein